MYFYIAVKKLIKEILPLNLNSDQKNIYQNFKQIQMKKLFSTSYSATSFNVGMLLLRLTVGGLMAHAGYYKLTHFNEILHGAGGNPPFHISFLGLGDSTNLSLLVFAELFCAGLLVIGLLTRLATIPLIISSCVALFSAHNGDIFGGGQMITLFLAGYVILLLVGPGKISVDGMVGK